RFIQLLEPRAEALGVDGAGRYRVDGDPILGELERDIAHEAVHAGLGRGVRRAAGVVCGPRCALARAGGHADDAAAAPAHHVRHRRARAQERRAEFRRSTKSQSSTFVSQILALRLPPTSFTRMSMRPKRSTHAAISRLAGASSVRSPATATAAPPAAGTAARVSA